ncbi:MFS transporter [Leuconostoc pseudomesenteroides]|mgnify:FL=1|uniref:MFS transporter n=1 Tax=Leuconostoc pseudomesenteroides TaxID=33968 RepID=UPI001B8C57C7|nr:MFS transporter [Leuconostoc pseudomesenteroides]MBS0958273.1 MFS transporter [Leuconostoc pseudomesenteroides]MCT4380320.1 MFS transporter [Leuconostoc pseudomesenteroides]WAM39511.1 MFS transporter [Leuconostoc pseudomesenteroides]
MLKNKNFLFLLFGQSAANIGDTLYIISVISAIYNLTHSVIASSLVPTVITCAMVIASFMSPLFTNKLKLNHILVSTQLIKAVFLAGLLFYIKNGFVKQNIFGLFVIISIIAFSDGFAQPVSQSILPHYAADNDLVKSNSILNTSFQILGIGGWAGGSILLAWLSVPSILVLSLALASLSVILLLQLQSVRIDQQTSGNNSIWHNLLKGWRTIDTVPLLKLTAVISILDTFANSVWISSIILAFVQKTLNASQYWWGYINAAYMFGGVLGGVLCYRLSQRIAKNPFSVMITGTTIVALVTFVVSINSNMWILLCLSGLVGIFGELKDIPQTALIQSRTDNKLLPNVFSSLTVLYTGTFSMASIFVSALSEQFGVRFVFVISSFLLVIVSVLLFFNKRLINQN